MFRNKMILGFILVVSLGLGSSWTVSKEPAQKPAGKSQGMVQAEVEEKLEVKSEPARVKAIEQKRTQAEIKGAQAVTQKEPKVNRIAREIREDYEKKMTILLETYREKCKLIRAKKEPLFQRLRELKYDGTNPECKRLNEELNKLSRELYQLQLWKEEQERLLKQEKEKREEEMAKKYLQTYVMKKILFLPWGSGKGEVGLREVEWKVQGIMPKRVRFCAADIKVDKDGNIYIWNKPWGKLASGDKEIKRIDNPYVHKYVKEKIRRGKEIIERYKYSSSFSLEEIKKGVPRIKMWGGRFYDEGYGYEAISGYRYEYYKKTEDRLGIKITDNTGVLVGKIKFEALEDTQTWCTYILGEDIKENIYILLDNTDVGAVGHQEWKLEVYKYTKEGKFLTKVKLSTDIDYTYRRHGQRDRIKVDKEGNIYQLLPKEDGVHILKWEIK